MAAYSNSDSPVSMCVVKSKVTKCDARKCGLPGRRRINLNYLNANYL